MAEKTEAGSAAESLHSRAHFWSPPRVPGAWAAQTRPGGTILTPWGTAFHNGVLARLTADGHGHAQGRFHGGVAFMWARGQRTPHGSVEDRVRPDHEYIETTTDLYPREPIADFDAAFAIGLQLVAVASTVVFEEDDSGTGRFTVYLMDPEGGSWASWHIAPDLKGRYPVRQHGPRRLFTELEAAYQWWQDEGRPAHDRFGLTVGPTAQTVWLDDPAHAIAMMP